MLKTGKAALPGVKGSAAGTALSFPGHPKSKLNLFTATSMLQQQQQHQQLQGAPCKLSPQPGDALSSLANGSVPRQALVKEEKQQQTTTTTSLKADPGGGGQLRHRGGGQPRMSAVSEEADTDLDGDRDGDRDADRGTESTAKTPSEIKKDERKDSPTRREHKEGREGAK